MADITRVPTWAGFLDLAAVLDAVGRRVVGRSMANHHRARLVLDALAMALLWRRRPDGVVHHADQGSRCTSLALGARCREAGVRVWPSTGSAGDCAPGQVCPGGAAGQQGTVGTVERVGEGQEEEEEAKPGSGDGDSGAGRLAAVSPTA